MKHFYVNQYIKKRKTLFNCFFLRNSTLCEIPHFATLPMTRFLIVNYEQSHNPQ